MSPTSTASGLWRRNDQDPLDPCPKASLARGNQVYRRVHDFAERIRGMIDQLDAIKKQQLLQMLIDEVRVTNGT
jgi:hypothetical protein